MDALKTVLIAAIFLSLSLSAATAQETNEAIEGPRSHVVTSLQSCLDKLDEADAADIRRNYTQQWQECQKRVQIKAEKEKMEKVKAISEGNETKPETPRNYVRVRKTEGKAKKEPAAEETKKTEEVKKN